jgi:hypothetical protein
MVATVSGLLPGVHRFDVPAAYVGINGKAMGHVAVEARPQRESPPRPCIGGRRLGNVVVSRWTAIEYRCSKDSNRVGRQARHGEGAHLGHLLLEWSSRELTTSRARAATQPRTWTF